MNTSIPNVVERAPALDRNERAAYRVTTEDLDLTAAIVGAVSEVTDSDPLCQSEVLYDRVDPDALERVFADCSDGPTRSFGRVVFDLRGCRVEVHADGEHVVYEPAAGRDESTTQIPESASG